MLLFLTLPLVTLQLQNLCQGTSNQSILYPQNHTCDAGKYCKNHWRVAVIVATSTSIFYTATLNALNSKNECGNKDSILFMSQSKWRTEQKCQLDQPTSDYFSKALGQFPFTYEDQYTTADTLADMMQFTMNCLESNPIESGQGEVIIFADFNCTQLCTIKMLSYQFPFCDQLLSQRYLITFYTNINGFCKPSGIFAQCGISAKYGSNPISLNEINFLCNNDNTEDSDRFYSSMFFLFISTVLPLFMFPLGLVCVRLKQRRDLISKRKSFKRKAAQNEYIDRAKSSGDMWEVNPENLEIFLEKPLGTGAFAIVYEGKLHGTSPVNNIIPSYKLRSERNENVAVKRPPPHADPIAKQEFLEEIRFMKKLGYHGHILGMVGCLSSGEMPLMILEYCEQGDLLLFLKRHRTTFTTDGDGSIKPKDLLSIAWQISDGLCYLKSLELIHRDLAARNVLITADLTAKISDFGLCRQPMSDSSNIYISRGGRLPVRWMAPESLRDYVFSFCSDVWSFGIVLWELFTLGDEPYKEIPGPAMLEALDSGTRLENKETIPDCIFNIMEHCWRTLPKYRRDIEEIRNNLHEILANTSDYYGYLNVKTDSEMEPGRVEEIEEDIQLNQQPKVIHPFFKVDNIDEHKEEILGGIEPETVEVYSILDDLNEALDMDKESHHSKNHIDSYSYPPTENGEIETNSLHKRSTERHLFRSKRISIEDEEYSYPPDEGQFKDPERFSASSSESENDEEEKVSRRSSIRLIEESFKEKDEVNEEDQEISPFGSILSRESEKSTEELGLVESGNLRTEDEARSRENSIQLVESEERKLDSSQPSGSIKEESDESTSLGPKRRRILELPGIGTVELDDTFFVQMNGGEFDNISIVEESREVLI